MCIVLLCTICSATPFLTGAYLEYYLGSGSAANFDIKTKLLEGRYNTIKTSVAEDLGGLESVLGTFGSDVKTILDDRCWNPTSGKVGINSLTYGNYLKMEAEYKYTFDETSGSFTPDLLTTTLDPTGMGDVYNYIFAHDATCGYRTDQGAHSNQYTWVCKEKDWVTIQDLHYQTPDFAGQSQDILTLDQ